MHTTRTGALVGVELIKRFNWHIGDRITLHSMIWVNKDGSSEWPLDIVGIVNGGPDDDRAVREPSCTSTTTISIRRAPTREGTVNQFVVSLDKGADPNQVAIAIDRLFANSSSETTTLNERAWFAANVRAGRRRADVRQLDHRRGAVHAAVSGRQHDVAIGSRSASGTRRAEGVGFGDTSVWLLVVAEAAVLSCVAAAIGLAIAAAVFPSVFKTLGAGRPSRCRRASIRSACGIALLLAVLSATIPALRARRLTVVEALSGTVDTMKYLPLLWAGLWRKPIRTVLTVLSIAVAFLLFGVLNGVIAGFDYAASKMSETRLRVMNRANILEAMPISYEARIAQVPGVRNVSHLAILVALLPGPEERLQRRRARARTLREDVFRDEGTERPASRRCATRAPARWSAANSRSGSTGTSAIGSRSIR